MSTRIVFDNGLSLRVAQNQADVIDAVRRHDLDDMSFEGRSHRLLHINWDHVVSIGSAPAMPRSSPRAVVARSDGETAVAR